jgi:hypothetical protein
LISQIIDDGGRFSVSEPPIILYMAKRGYTRDTIRGGASDWDVSRPFSSYLRLLGSLLAHPVRFFEVLPRFGVGVKDASNMNLKEAISSRTRMIYVETPCNPRARSIPASAHSGDVSRGIGPASPARS